MTTTQEHATEQTPTRRPRDTSLPGPEARERLLSELSVSERRLDLNGVSTAVLEERQAVQRALEELVAERADADGVARLTSPVNIGVGTK